MELFLKKIETQGITYLEPLHGSWEYRSREWYWGMDYTSGDLYEAEELFRQGHPVNQNKLLFVHYPDGKVFQPVIAKEGQYFGRPVYDQGKIVILLVDFPAGKIQILQFDGDSEQGGVLANLPLSITEDCYNLLLRESPLMLTRQAMDNTFEILWPETARFKIGDRESFAFRSGERLYFSAFCEEPEYREEVIVREMNTGKVLDRIDGSLMLMPDGQRWILT